MNGPDDAWLVRLRERVAERRGDRPRAIAGGDPPLLSVVVLNWNGAAVVGRCLDHLLAQTHPRVQVVAVDNGSRDGSLDELRRRAALGQIELVESATNRGVAGGRNLGLARARGEIVAFLDDDAFADPAWAAEIAGSFAADQQIGAVASLVFFDGHKAILNSAGGTLNLRGHGADWCFNTPYELAVLPEEVLYPTGCGMAFRRSVLEAIGPHDEAIAYYGYDDVELGLGARARGCRIGLARTAWVDHEGGHSARLHPAQALWRERGRIRNALKYLPAARLAGWLLHEAQLIDYLRSLRTASLPLRAWTWNLRHLGSAIERRRAATEIADVDRLLHPSWRGFPWLSPDNRAFRPKLHCATSRVALDGRDDRYVLVFGWHDAECVEAVHFRRSAAVASLLVESRTPRRLTVNWRAMRPGEAVALELRVPGEIDPVWRSSAVPPPHWESRGFDCDLPAGVYEMLLRTESSVAIASVEID